jgi:glycosyltransferase involved in cell wall biosynthesis
MNVCLITAEYPPETNWGGIATYTKVLAKHLTKLGHKTIVISATKKKEYNYSDEGVMVYRINYSPKNILSWAIINNPIRPFNPLLNFSCRVFEKVSEILKNDRIDIIEAPETLAQAFLLFKKRRSIPSVTRLHTPNFLVRELNNIDTTKTFTKRDYLEKTQTALSYGITSPTKALANIVEHKWNIKNIKIIPNFFDLRQYQPDESIYNAFFKDEEYLLFYGRLEVRKGVHILAKALPAIFRKHPKIKMAFIGKDFDYAERGSMKNYIISMNSEFHENLLFVDSIPHDQLYPIIQQAKLVILPSLWENFPYACLEAMSFGKVVVATSGSGYGEILEDGVSGYLVEPGNVQKLEQKITNLLKTNPDPAIGRNAKARINSFKPTVVVNNMVKYYKEIIKKIKVAGRGCKILF